MSDRTLDRLEDRVGESVESVQGLTVEAGKVAEFATAVGDDDPTFRDPDVASQRGFKQIPAPPTFTRTSMFPRYRPTGVGRLGFDLGFDIRYELHGEQSYKFARPVYVGDTLSGRTTLTDAYEREGRQGGTMTFAILETEYTDEAGELVVTERETIIEAPESSDGGDDGHAPPRESGPDGASVRQPASGFDAVRSTDDVSVGDSGPTVIVEGLARQDFVQYAGASGDFNPIHYDEPYARALGNDAVFGQGMLTAGYAGHFVSDWFGLDAVRRFNSRFTARVWPGDTLTVSGEVTGVDSSEITAELSVTRQTGETVLLGDVTATLSHADAE